MFRASFLAAFVLFLPGFIAAEGFAAAPEPDVHYGKFVGGTPREKEVMMFLGVPESKEWECNWTLELFEDAKHTPTTYRIVAEYGPYSFQTPKDEQRRESKIREGKWSFGKLARSPHWRTIELEGGQKLLEVSKNVLHFLGAKDELIVGHGGWSYSLHRADAAEKRGDWHLARAKPESEVTYTIGPLATGAGVHAVFEGRTPYKGIAGQLGLPWDEGCLKAKWRLTLFQDEKSKTPSEYKIEGSLFKATPREGKWRMEKGAEGAPFKVVLEATKTQPELVLLLIDDDVAFVTAKSSEPRVGNSEFSYTLNRKAAAAGG